MKSKHLPAGPRFALARRFNEWLSHATGAAAAAAAATLALAAPSQAEPAPAHGIVAAAIGVQQLGFENPPANVIVTNRYAIGDFRIRPTANKGDYDAQIGETTEDDIDGGVLITSIAENGGRDNLDEFGSPDPVYPGVNTATSHIDYTRTGANFGYFIPLAMTYPNTLGTTVVEYNLNVNAAWFPYGKWLGAFIRNSGATNGGANNLISGSSQLVLGTHFIDLGAGRSTVNLTTLGINSQTDGVLLVMGAKNEDNYALSQANADGTWSIYSKDNGTDGASYEQDPIAFVYIPKTNATVISGRFNGDGSVAIAGGSFSITPVETGRWELKIPGRNAENGVLLVSPEGGLAQNRDNIVSAAPNTANDGWIIESRDLQNPNGLYLPDLETPGVEPVASFVFVPGATAGFTVTPTNNVFTTENGGSGAFTVQLDTPPKSNVTVAISVASPEATVSPASLTFTPDDWAAPQTVTVTGQDDAAADGPIAYVVDLAPAASEDAAYNNIDPANVSAVNLDNDGAITINPTAGLTVTEAGGSASFAVHLDQAPTSDVVIALSASDATEGSVSPASLTFTAADWNIDQTVTITGLDDSLDDGDVHFTIVTAPAVSADTFFSGKNAADVAVTNTDDDSAGINVSPVRDLIVGEAGGTAAYTIVLTSQPLADVAIATSSSDATEAVVAPATLAFTASNWSTPQTVTVTGVDNLIPDGNRAFTISNVVATADALYAGIVPSNVTGTTIDNEAAITLLADKIAWGVGMPPIGVAGRITLSDTNTLDFTGAALTVAFLENQSAGDALAIRSSGNGPGQISVAADKISFAGVEIGSFTTNASSLRATFTAAATSEGIEALARSVTFENTNANPATALRKLKIDFQHADGGLTSAATAIRVGLLRETNFQEGADFGYGPYAGAADTELYELQADSPKPAGRGAAGIFIDWRDADTPNTGQMLLRFDNLVGGEPWQIPTNSIIVSAELFLNVTDSGDGSPLYRMLVPWDAENDTWNSVGGGITPDDTRARSSFDSQIGVEDGSGATTVGTVWVSVTPDIMAWVNGGETNYGWALPGWPLRLDGTGINPSEAPNIANRPRLRVAWLPKDSAGVASFQQGVNEYAGTVDTRIRQATPDLDFFAAGTVFVDAIVTGTDPNPEHVLVRFDDIFGANAGQIPPGARIEAAMLDVASVNGDAMGDGGMIFSLLQPWPEIGTWNGWVDGVQTNGVEAAAIPSATAGFPELNPDVQGGFLSFELTADVQAWANGSRTNAGWVMIPWPGGGNGWGFTTSENATERNRPRLRVFYAASTAVEEIKFLPTTVAAGAVQLRFTAAPSAALSVYRALTVDGEFAKIGTVTTGTDGAGAFTDPAPPTAAAFYRLGAQ